MVAAKDFPPRTVDLLYNVRIFQTEFKLSTIINKNVLDNRQIFILVLMAILLACNSQLETAKLLQKHWTNALKHLAGGGGYQRRQSILKLENLWSCEMIYGCNSNRKKGHSVLLVPQFKCNRAPELISICPFAPDYKNILLINKTHLICWVVFWLIPSRGGGWCLEGKGKRSKDQQW